MAVQGIDELKDRLRGLDIETLRDYHGAVQRAIPLTTKKDKVLLGTLRVALYQLILEHEGYDPEKGGL